MSESQQGYWHLASPRTALCPLDAAIEYLRERYQLIIPLYLFAMAPFTLAIYNLIQVVVAQHRSSLPSSCFFLLVATIWRWIGLSILQRNVQANVRGEPPRPLRSRLISILIVKVASSCLVTWGMFAVIPFYFGFYLTSFAAPLLLEKKGHAFPVVIEAIQWIFKSTTRLLKVQVAMMMASVILMIATLVLQFFLINTALAQIFGLDMDTVSLTLRTSTWMFCLLYGFFLIMDLLWSVGSVMVFYDVHARRLGNDLRVRLRSLQEAKS